MLKLRFLPPVQPLDLRFVVPQPAPAAPIAAVIGPPGPSGSPSIVRIAGETLGGHRAVEIGSDGRARYPTGPRIAGVTTGAAVAGAPVTIRTDGELVEPSWSWLPGVVWLGGDGMLVQTPPTAGWLVEVGVAAGPTALIINTRLVAHL